MDVRASAEGLALVQKRISPLAAAEQEERSRRDFRAYPATVRPERKNARKPRPKKSARDLLTSFG
jgi:hypothetical protein